MLEMQLLAILKIQRMKTGERHFPLTSMEHSGGANMELVS